MEQRTIRAECGIFMHNIRWLRKRYGYTKKKMAEILGIGLWSLNKLERGEMPPRLRIDILRAVHAHFGITPSEQLSRRLEQ